ncbi:hypothetical protein KSC_060270 [Ktedonobacter sp. SOSP1-52]|uniref:hypothetical protein n=1 Tax=Ktedonobacter sp. SOSP1-52 TaxID=2778366 RepID=UPI001914FF5C|nr:hypothetical protein [Ktedonobacter sp. SOSP1-52]GHO67135.1 hypothetical protein KSC_060270 [Ktedonobacter sp. SOSP1-52]
MFSEDDFETIAHETGSDDLLSEDDLRLPEGANVLVRVHAVRAWLTRRRQDADLAIGQVALALQMLMQDEPESSRPRRRRVQQTDPYTRVLELQQELQAAQDHLQAYTEAEELFEDYLTHTTSSDRVLVEYYLAIENLCLELTEAPQEAEGSQAIRQQVFEEVLHRLERVTAPETD